MTDARSVSDGITGDTEEIIGKRDKLSGQIDAFGSKANNAINFLIEYKQLMLKIIAGDAKASKTAEETDALNTMKLERKKLQTRFIII